MSPISSNASQGQHKHACSTCARRKVRCDKGTPCSNCVKAQCECVYEAPAPYRPRKRAADEDLLARLEVYEGLMRKHNVDFATYAHTWVPSGLVPKIKEASSPRAAPETPANACSRSRIGGSESSVAGMERCSWSDLSADLKHPPIQGLCHKDDPLLHPMPSLRSVFDGMQSKIQSLHPEPRQIYRLWQTFVESVNPLLKIVHVPTLQQRILDASWDPEKASKSLTAIMFAVYALAVTSSPSEDCQAVFCETRGALMTRYRAAALRALVEAEFLTTKDFEVLQALVLFLFTNPECDLTSTLTAAALKLGRDMGLHLGETVSRVSVFETEMRVRLWWQLYGLDARNRALNTPETRISQSSKEFGDCRLPLNVNDVDLHPDMTDLPAEHNGLTEMMCVLMKYEVFQWIRSSPEASNIMENIARGRVRDERSVGVGGKAINAIEAIYQAKYFANIDKRIPLHAQTYSMAKLVLARMRFKVHHPRGRAAIGGGDVYMTREEGEMLFDLALSWVELMEAGLDSKFSSHIFTHMTSKCHIDAYIYVISDLRRRYSGDRVAQAWKSIERFYDTHPQLMGDMKNTFYGALADLTLEAWEARRQELVYGQGLRECDVTPPFIQLLWDKRRGKDGGMVQLPTASELQGVDGIGLMADGNLDWDYWNNFLTL